MAFGVAGSLSGQVVQEAFFHIISGADVVAVVLTKQNVEVIHL